MIDAVRDGLADVHQNTGQLVQALADCLEHNVSGPQGRRRLPARVRFVALRIIRFFRRPEVHVDL